MQGSEKKLKVLVVDDDLDLCHGVADLLKGFSSHDREVGITLDVHVAGDAPTGIQALAESNFDVILMDVRMPELSGLEALRIIKEKYPRVFVVMMTAHSNLQDAIEAIRSGAYDYLEKPVKPEKLKEIIIRSQVARNLVEDLALSSPVFDDDIESEFVGKSTQMKEIYSLIYRLCKVDTSVLIRGENGTGKELVARAIHYNSHRKVGSFVAVNCGAIPDNLIESEFFGHEKGAFTGAVERKIGRFQSANNGTLFLDEIGELKPDMQVKLLRVLQEKTFTPVGSSREIKTNARIVAATNRNLEQMIERGIFREDLFYRLNVMPIFLPPLRERLEDIPLLAQHFVNLLKARHPSSPAGGFQQEALDCMKQYRWPGNIRELENLVERCLILETETFIRVQTLPENIRQGLKPQSMTLKSLLNVNTETPPNTTGGFDFETFKEASEKEFIVRALKANDGRINQTVARANIPKNTLLRKIKKYGIDVKSLE